MNTYALLLFALLDVILVLIAYLLLQQQRAYAPVPVTVPAVAGRPTLPPSAQHDKIKIPVTDRVLEVINTRMAQGYVVAHVGASYVVMVKRFA